ncbi:ABC transporter ATP-binding protein [Telmatospirillum sp. J64-1]|uniref:ABC transporter ATP-binding protein n=1 Tax=Telmatospirillum sp. J64-1 TaxID=2502183 RepID=UPI001C8F3816|nr:ABC transporter ATP-binding protein [Telmatospirillum sp. J64-1]
MMLDSTTCTATAPSVSAKHAVRLDGIGKSFGDVTALRDVWLKINHGEFLTLLGPSGCGKTTLLNMLAGFLTPDTGEVFIGNDCVTEMPPHQRDIGLVFQNYALFPHMSVAENVAFGLKMRKIPREEIRRRVAEALENVRLGAFGDRKPRALSGGQQQRVALARALVIRPRLLLLDESLSALDKNLRSDMQVELKEIQRRVGITTIFVTHDQGEALSLSDRIAVMAHGEIQQLSTPAEMYRSPANSFVASFIGDINQIGGMVERIEGEEALLVLGANNLRLAVPLSRCQGVKAGDGIRLFVRPEHLRLTQEGGQLRGILRARSYQGTHVEAFLDVDGADLVRVRLNRPGLAEALSQGAELGLDIDAAECLVFPQEDKQP